MLSIPTPQDTALLHLFSVAAGAAVILCVASAIVRKSLVPLLPVAALAIVSPPIDTLAFAISIGVSSVCVGILAARRAATRNRKKEPPKAG